MTMTARGVGTGCQPSNGPMRTFLWIEIRPLSFEARTSPPSSSPHFANISSRPGRNVSSGIRAWMPWGETSMLNGETRKRVWTPRETARLIS